MVAIARTITTSTGIGGAPGITAIYWQPGTVGGSVADATDCAARVRAFFQAVRAYIPTVCTYQTSGTTEMIDAFTGNLLAAFTGTTPAAVTGSGGTGVLPRAAAILIQARTGAVINSRFIRGRTFLAPVVSSTQGVGGTVDPTAAGIITTAANAMLTGGGTASVPTIWHRPNTTGLGNESPVVAYTVWSEFAALRSRRD